MSENLAFVDTETTGTDSKRHTIVQIGGIIEIDGKEMEEFEIDIDPFPSSEIDPAALKIIGKTEEDLHRGLQPLQAHERLTGILRKYVDKYDRLDKFDIAGFGVTFDDDFLRQWFMKCGDKYYGSYFRWPPIDIAVLAAARLIGKRDASNFKLETVAEKFGIQVDKSKTHGALYDARLARKLFKVVGRELDAIIEEIGT